MYRQLEHQLRAMIVEGALGAGAALPPERKLALHLGISRKTVQQCYDALRRQRLISAHGRHGYIVEDGFRRIKPGMERLKGFTEEMQELGRVPSSRILERVVGEDRSIASIFGLTSTAQFLRLVRVRLGDDMPLSVEKAWYDLGVLPSLADGDLSGSIYARLAESGAPLVDCEQTIEAAWPDPRECAIFGFAEPLPCLLIKRRSYGADARMIEYVEGLFRGDAYAYRLRLRS
ncbi:GntR family transcriptional regulator [Methylobacterium marchantiae]|uniref:GntR family transcriptional regulator n=1 Tax=Methylobacterium marchantiae TaxID=600331 RepID=A0ABW3WU85_9HYPH|nr:HTH-type transcriptional repressor NagR [Methylobacterium marchantiae]